jgi:hypothetical protein
MNMLFHTGGSRAKDLDRLVIETYLKPALSLTTAHVSSFFEVREHEYSVTGCHRIEVLFSSRISLHSIVIHSNQVIRERKRSVAHLSIPQLMRMDAKYGSFTSSGTNGGLGFGIASMPLSITDLIHKGHVSSLAGGEAQSAESAAAAGARVDPTSLQPILSVLSSIAASKGVQVMMIMTIVPPSAGRESYRELLLWFPHPASGDEAWRHCAAGLISTLEASATLNLLRVPLTDAARLNESHVGVVALWVQNNFQATRKQVLPLVSDYLRTYNPTKAFL